MDPRVPVGLGQRVYDDFSPRTDWLREEKTDILLVDLPGFKKEQLKVQMDNYGNLKISGERPLTANRWTRFRKEFKIPENCNAGEIRAKFDNGLLYVTMPRLEIIQLPKTDEQQIQQAPSPPEETNTGVADSIHSTAAAGDDHMQEKSDDAGTEEESRRAMPSDQGDPLEETKQALGEPTKRAAAGLNIVAALVVLVAIAVYFAYRLKKGSEDMI